MRLDLHGYTVHNAWARFCAFIVDCKYAGHKSVVIVTGQGEIEKELPVWADLDPNIRSCEQANPGAYRIYLKKG
jgi:DNA-nicking Smr family endonuclease